MFNIKQFREVLVRPTLEELKVWSKSAEELLVMTCAAETNGGMFLRQVEGPALGVYQMEEETHESLWNNYLSKHTYHIYVMLRGINLTYKPRAEMMVFNLKYATQMARVHYLAVPERLPEHDDIEGLAAYYKKYWATPLSKATINGAIEKYYAFAGKEKEEVKSVAAVKKKK